MQYWLPAQKQKHRNRSTSSYGPGHCHKSAPGQVTPVTSVALRPCSAKCQAVGTPWGKPSGAPCLCDRKKATKGSSKTFKVNTTLMEQTLQLDPCFCVCAHVCVYKRQFGALIYISHMQFPKNLLVSTKECIVFYMEITTDCIVTLLNRSHHYLSVVSTQKQSWH